MNMMRSGLAWLNRQRDAFCAETVEYIHYEGEIPFAVRLNATRGRTIFRAEDGYGIVTRVQSVDFIVSASDLVMMPEKGDEIVFDGLRYEVLAPNNEPVWRYSGNGEEMVRIHTKCVGKVDYGA